MNVGGLASVSTENGHGPRPTPSAVKRKQASRPNRMLENSVFRFLPTVGMGYHYTSAEAMYKPHDATTARRLDLILLRSSTTLVVHSMVPERSVRSMVNLSIAN